ncbi:hypothetical protein DAMA08_026470 [Martiniozyma asiatica (nom. inval.)]|nr:hypothetical protein DAMA08_026470 [Martiniozyma asiatica]
MQQKFSIKTAALTQMFNYTIITLYKLQFFICLASPFVNTTMAITEEITANTNATLINLN